MMSLVSKNSTTTSHFESTFQTSRKTREYTTQWERQLTDDSAPKQWERELTDDSEPSLCMTMDAFSVDTQTRPALIPSFIRKALSPNLHDCGGCGGSHGRSDAIGADAAHATATERIVIFERCVLRLSCRLER